MLESTCRKVGRCLEDNCRWQQLQLWFRPSSTTSSTTSSPSPSSSSPAFPSSSLSNPFSLDHPLFRHYFRIRSSFCHFSLLSPTITRTKGHFEKDQCGQPFSRMISRFQKSVSLWISAGCHISWFVVLDISDWEAPESLWLWGRLEGFSSSDELFSAGTVFVFVYLYIWLVALAIKASFDQLICSTLVLVKTIQIGSQILFAFTQN